MVMGMGNVDVSEISSRKVRLIHRKFSVLRGEREAPFLQYNSDEYYIQDAR